MTHDSRKPLYSVQECKDRIKEIDEKISKYEDVPTVFKDGPISANTQNKINYLQKERGKWEERLEKAIQWEEAEDRGEIPTVMQGPTFELT